MESIFIGNLQDTNACRKANGGKRFFGVYGLRQGDEPDGDRKPPNQWRLIQGLIKYFRFSREEIFWEYSWANLVMLMSSIPKFGEEEDEKEEKLPGEIDNFGEIMGAF